MCFQGDLYWQEYFLGFVLIVRLSYSKMRYGRATNIFIYFSRNKWYNFQGNIKHFGSKDNTTILWIWLHILVKQLNDSKSKCFWTTVFGFVFELADVWYRFENWSRIWSVFRNFPYMILRNLYSHISNFYLTRKSHIPLLPQTFSQIFLKISPYFESFSIFFNFFW